MLVKTLFGRNFLTYQIFILISTFICYTGFHMSRKPISIVKSVLHGKCEAKQGYPSNWCHWKPFDGNDWSEKLGFLEYGYLLTYALFMFVSGHLAERINLRLYLGLGMVFSGILTAAFGMGYFFNIHNYSYYFILQILTGIFQATGWPAVVTIMGHWFGKGKRGFIMGIWNSHTSVGNMIGSLLAGIFVASNWGYSFVLPGFILMILGFIVVLTMIPSPEEIGFSSPDDPKKCYPEVDHRYQKVLVQLRKSSSSINENKLNSSSIFVDLSDKNSLLSDKEKITRSNSNNSANPPANGAISICDALKIPGVIPYSLSLFFAKLVAYTFLYWLPNYLNQVGAGLDPKQAAFLSTLFDLGGVVGGILAGYLSDLWIVRAMSFNSHKSSISADSRVSSIGRAGVCALMLIMAAPMLFCYQKFAANHSFFSNFLLFMCGLFVNGPYALITTAVSADLGTTCEKNHFRALATVTAIIDGTGSMGAALGPFLTGWIVPYGWDKVFVMLITADIIALIGISYIIITNVLINRTSDTNSKDSNYLFSIDTYCSSFIRFSRTKCAIFLITCVIMLLLFFSFIYRFYSIN